jgi:integrase
MKYDPDVTAAPTLIPWHLNQAGQADLGCMVVSRLRQLMDLLQAPGSPTSNSSPGRVYGRLQAEAAAIEANSDPVRVARNLSDPAFGIVRKAPAWACMLAAHNDTGPVGGDYIRLVLFVAHVLKQPVPPDDWQVLRSAIRKGDSHPLNDTQLAVVRSYFRRPGAETFRAFETFVGTRARLDFHDHQARLFRRTLNAIRDVFSLDGAAPQAPVLVPASMVEGVGPQTHGARRRDRPSSTLAGFAAASAADDRAEDERASTQFAHRSLGAESKDVQRSALDRSWRLIARSLEPDRDHALLAPESRTAARALMTGLSKQLTSPSPQGAAALIWMMSLLYGEHPWRVHADIEARNQGPDSRLRRDERTGRWVYAVALPFRDPSDQFFGDRTSGVFERPVPAAIGQCLDQQGRIGGEALQQTLEAVRCELARVCPRFTLSRCRMTLPVALQALTGDATLAMMISGQDFGLSSAPLHYYAPEHRELAAHFARFGQIYCELECPVDERSDRIGGPTAAFADELIREAIAAGMSEVRQALASGDPVAVDNAITIWAARMWTAATGHRGWKTIRRLTLAGIDPRGFCVMDDKPGSVLPMERVAAVPALLIQQIEALLIHRRRHIRSYPDAARKHIEDSILGRGPLFFLIGDKGEVRRIASSDLAFEQFGLPVNVFRARLRTHLTREGVSPRRIFAQLGHVYLGRQAVDAESLESLVDLAGALNPVIDRCLRADGWRVLPDLPLPKFEWPVAALREPLNARWEARLRRHKALSRETSFRRRHPIDRAEDDAWVRARLEAFMGGIPLEKAPRGLAVRDADIEAWQSALADCELPARRQLQRWASMRTAIHALRRRHGWLGSVPTLASSAPRLEPTHIAAHVQAARLAMAIRARLLDADRVWMLIGLAGAEDGPPGAPPLPARIQAGDPRLSPRVRWVRLAGLLVVDRTILSLSHLEEALSRVSSGHLASLEGADVIDVSFEGDGLHARRLSHEAALLARGLRGLEPPSLQQVTADLTAVLAIFKLPKASAQSDQGADPTIARLIDVARLAARIEEPGIRWALVERDHPNTLSLKRTQDGLEHRLGINRPPDGRPQNPASETIPCETPLPVRECVRQYRAFTKEVWAQREPEAARQGFAAKRFAKTLGLCHALTESAATDARLFLLARFVSALLSTASHLQIRGAYGALTSIGLRLILAVPAQRSILHLDSEELLEVYLAVIEQAPAKAKRRIISNLIRFHRAQGDLLPALDFSELYELAGRDPPVQALRAEIITPAERDAVQELLADLRERGANSDQDARERKVLVILLWELGARSAECTHLQVEDLFECDGRWFAWIRTNRLGRLKNAGSRRVVCLSDCLRKADLDLVIAQRQYAAEQGWRGLFNAEGLAQVLEDIRELTSQVSGGQVSGLHAYRHARITRGLHELLGAQHPADPDIAPAALRDAARVGHAGMRTSIGCYWHFDHLRSCPLPRLDSTVSALLTGVPPGTLRSSASRARAAGGQANARVKDQSAEMLKDEQRQKILSDAGPSGITFLRVVNFLAALTCLPVDVALRRTTLTPAQQQRVLRAVATIQLQRGCYLLREDTWAQLRDFGLGMGAPLQGRVWRIGVPRRDAKALLKHPPGGWDGDLGAAWTLLGRRGEIRVQAEADVKKSLQNSAVGVDWRVWALLVVASEIARNPER